MTYELSSNHCGNCYMPVIIEQDIGQVNAIPTVIPSCSCANDAASEDDGDIAWFQLYQVSDALARLIPQSRKLECSKRYINRAPSMLYYINTDKLMADLENTLMDES